MNIRQGNLIIINIPFSDQTGRKVRPAIVVSNNNFQKSCEDCLVVPITSVLKDVPFSLAFEQEDLENGILIKKSRVRIDKITSIKQSLILKSVGKIKKEFLMEINEEIKNALKKD
jgi:mRNA interferase MazF